MFQENRIASNWRRQIAAVRIANAYFAGSGVLVVLLISIPSASLIFTSLRSGSLLSIFDDPRFPFLPVALLFGGLIVFHLWGVRKSTRRVLSHSPVLEALASGVLPQIRSRLAPASNREIDIYLDPNGLPMEVTRRRKRLIVNLHPELAAFVLFRPKAMGGLLAHEMTHSFQWDTTLGHVWYRVSVFGFGALLALYVLLSLLFGVVAVAELLKGRMAEVTNILPYLAVFLLGIPYSLGGGAFCFAIRRWMEYSADVSAVLAGYGSELATLLSLSRPFQQRSLVRRIFSAYPTTGERWARLTRIVGSANELDGSDQLNESDSSVHNSTEIRFPDYIKGLFLSLLPAMAPMVLLATFFAYFVNSTNVAQVPALGR